MSIKYFHGNVLYLQFDERAGTTVYDQSGYGNNGTIRGASWEKTGKIGYCLSFDGVDDYVEVLDSPSISPTVAITVVAWIKSSVEQYSQGVITKGPPTSDYDYMFYFSGGGTSLAFYMKDKAGTFDYLNTTFKWSDGKWHHYVAVFDGDWLYLYIDGVLKASKDTSLTNIRDSTNPLQIGRGWAGYFKGFIDEVRIYNRALTEKEIKAIYYQGVQKFQLNPIVQHFREPLK